MQISNTAEQAQQSGLHIIQQLLPYNERLPLRSLNGLDLVVVHCTELPSLEISREYGEQVIYPETRTGNSGHFYIDLDGAVYQWIEVERVAHHVRGMNERSIGIEIVNAGRYPDWYRSDQQLMADPYTAPQIVTMKKLLQRLERIIPGLSWIAGHDELDKELVPAEDNPEILIRRKVDPGPLFPWKEVMADSDLTRWPENSVYG